MKTKETYPTTDPVQLEPDRLNEMSHPRDNKPFCNKYILSLNFLALITVSLGAIMGTTITQSDIPKMEN